MEEKSANEKKKKKKSCEEKKQGARGKTNLGRESDLWTCEQ